MASAAQATRNLRIVQYRRHARDGVERSMTRKELLEEVNGLTSVGRLAPLSPPTRGTPSMHRSQSSINTLRPRDVRKVDPSFATRLEPAILVRSGCIILSLGRILSLVTRESLYLVLREGRDGLYDLSLIHI